MPQSKNNKRPISPGKASVQNNGKKVANSPNKSAARSLSLTESETMDQTTSAGGGAHAALEMAMSGPPLWFRDFESRQEDRFNKMKNYNLELIDGIKIELDKRFKVMEGELSSMTLKLNLAEKKLDDLENRSRRQNIIIFNLPEQTEGQNCIEYVCNLMKASGVTINNLHIQRAHRTGQIDKTSPNPKPRPIHIAFAFYQEKEMCRKALAEYFKKNTVAGAKLYVANDYSAKVQQMRRDKVPELRRLRAEGKMAFLVYPATIKVKDSHGNIRNA